MKKLMIAAAAVAMVGGVYAASGCNPQEVKPVDSAWVYNWKFTGKTTEGVLKVTEAIPVGCLVGGIPSQMEAIRVPASLKIQGYTVKCNPTCLDVEEAAFVGNSAKEGEAFWITKPTKGFFGAILKDGTVIPAGVSFKFGNVIGRAAGKYEVLGSFKGIESLNGEIYALAFAGQGSYNKNKTRVTSASGNFAGTMIVPHYHVYVKELDGCPKATVWDCAGFQFLNVEDHAFTAAFGKWSMKYNATASANFATKGVRPATKNLAPYVYGE